MPLESIGVLMRRASRGGYALGYFESWNLESLQGVIDAAEQTRSPVIIGFNGGFLSSAGRRAAENLAWYAALGGRPPGRPRSPAASSSMNARRTSGSGRPSPAASTWSCRPIRNSPFDRYARWVTALTRLAHAQEVAVEAEIGELPAGVAGHGSAGGTLTDPAWRPSSPRPPGSTSWP